LEVPVGRLFTPIGLPHGVPEGFDGLRNGDDRHVLT
jgi:hypothetical protein